jgi:hypothetical protein
MQDDDPPALATLTVLDRAIRILFGAAAAMLAMFAFSPLLEPIGDVFWSVAVIVALLAGVATMVWGDRFLEPFLRAIGRI